MTTKSRKTKAKASKLFPDELIDQLLARIRNKDAESILGESGLAGQLKKQLAALFRLLGNGGALAIDAFTYCSNEKAGKSMSSESTGFTAMRD